MTLLEERLARLQLVVVTGKGGVGKSTLTAALGGILAREGKQVLLLEIDSRESLYQLLDVSPSGGDVVRAGPGLYVQNLSPRAVLDEVVREQLRIDLLVRRVLTSPVYQQFAEAAPGLKELAALGHALRIVRGLAGSAMPPIDLVLLDAPATGHGVSMLAAPKLVSEVIEEGPFGRMGRELADFISDADACGIVVATQAEEMPVQEALELIQSLRERLARNPEVVLVNGLYPTIDTSGSSGDALVLVRQRREVNDRQLRRLRETWPGPRIDLPLLPLERGIELARELGRGLEGGLLETTWS